MKHRDTRRAGPLVFRDPVLLCGALYVLLYFDASGFLRLGLLAAFLHEGGHILLYCAFFHRFPVIEVTMTGFCMRLSGDSLSPGRRFWLAAAGPAVNFALAGLWALRLGRNMTIRGSAFWAANLLTGAFNLLPIPGLDGSRFVFLLIEAIRRKPVPKNREAMVHLIGMAALFLLMILVTVQDITRFFR